MDISSSKTSFVPSYYLFGVCYACIQSFHFLIFFLSNREYAARIPRPFSVRYNPYTDSVEVLDSKHQILKLATDIRAEVSTLHDALTKYE